MPRVSVVTVRRAKRKKLLARDQRHVRQQEQALSAAGKSADTALKYAFCRRRRKKRDFRRLWLCASTPQRASMA